MTADISKMRNIGISAHIDSGKTTLTERILFYTKRIHSIHEVHGKDGVGATMDSMELEKERGITIASAATNVEWQGHQVNIIDTPGHIDFTIEVERALRVLDGAILVLCAVGGVQSQSITVDRQLKRYRVPRLAFINKCDRVGADPEKVTRQLRESLDLNTVQVQIPIGLEDKLEGVIDLVKMEAIYFEGNSGEKVRKSDIPENLKEPAAVKREEMLDALSMFSDELAEAFLEEEETEEQIYQALRKGILDLELTPVFVGSAYKNIGVQSLMDGVVKYLPEPGDIQNTAFNLEENEREVQLTANPDLPAVALAFKLEDGQYGQLTYIRIYQGTISKGTELYNSRSRKKFKVGRLVRMHADDMEDIDYALCGDIVALFGVDCSSGDTFTQTALNYSMTSMHIPEPVISLAVKPADKISSDNLTKALNRFTKEDPTFRTHVDQESNETIISGMGELHLEVYLERVKREFNSRVETGMPQVAYRESITCSADFNYTHKKQTGGSGQFARIAGNIAPLAEGDYEFVDKIKGGAIPREYIPACDKGFKSTLAKGSLIGFPIIGVKVTINDGSSHAVDSSDLAFQMAAIGAFKEVYKRAKPEILEPVMKVVVEGPTEYQGNIFASINQRRGIIESTTEDGNGCKVEAIVPLSEMFGYATALRSLTQGKAEFTMEFARYSRLPADLAEKLIEEQQKKKK